MILLKTLLTILLLSACVAHNPRDYQKQLAELREQIRIANEELQVMREILRDIQADLVINEASPIECTCIGGEVLDAESF